MAQFGVLALPPLLSCSGGNYAMQFRSDISGKHSTRSVAAVVAHNDVQSNIAATCSVLFGSAASTSEPPLSPQLVPPLAPAAPRDDDTEETLRQIRLDVLMRKPRPRPGQPMGDAGGQSQQGRPQSQSRSRVYDQVQEVPID